MLCIKQTDNATEYVFTEKVCYFVISFYLHFIFSFWRSLNKTM